MPSVIDRARGAMLGFLDRRIDNYIRKAVTPGLAGGSPAYPPTIDSFRRRAQPSKRALLDSLRGFAYAAASKNALAVAQVPLRLYSRTMKGQETTKGYAEPRPVDPRRMEYLRYGSSPYVQKYVSRSDKLEEVTEHPILKVFQSVNPWMNQYDLIRLLSLELDTTGEGYWFPRRTGYQVPGEIWPLESWRIRPLPSFRENEILAGYEYSGQKRATTYAVEDLIQFRFVSPQDPYGTGYSPMRAAFEYVELANDLLAYEAALVNNRARPDLLISPTEPVTRGMARRLEERVNEKFRRGGGGGAMVGEYGFSFSPYTWSPIDMGNTALRKACEDTIAACLDVPISMLRVESVNRANAEAGKFQHADNAVRPRCIMIEQKLNEKLMPLWDSADRLMLAFDNPVPDDADRQRADMAAQITAGVRSPNEWRKKLGDVEVPGGEEPLVNPALVPLSMLRDQLQRGNDMQDRQMQMQEDAAKQQPPMAQAGPRGLKRFLMKRVDTLVRKRLEEERLAGHDLAGCEWPDMPFQETNGHLKP
jgi:HK97 family phage portal protein